jgi:hypothetical protein
MEGSIVTNEKTLEILKKAFRKAFDNGWQMVTPDDATRRRIDDPVDDAIDYWDLDWHEWRDGYYHLIFNHDFARALWSENKLFRDNDTGEENETFEYLGLRWQYHLQQMVISDCPIIFGYLLGWTSAVLGILIGAFVWR